MPPSNTSPVSLSGTGTCIEPNSTKAPRGRSFGGMGLNFLWQEDCTLSSPKAQPLAWLPAIKNRRSHVPTSPPLSRVRG